MCAWPPCKLSRRVVRHAEVNRNQSRKLASVRVCRGMRGVSDVWANSLRLCRRQVEHFSLNVGLVRQFQSMLLFQHMLSRQLGTTT